MNGAAPSPRHMIFNSFSGQFNVTFITIASTPNYSSLQKKQSITPQAVFAFGISNLLNILQLKYQGKPNSPFDTHPITTGIAIISFLIYCFLVYWLGFHAELRMIPTTTTRRTCANVIHQAVRLLGYFSLAAFASILFATGTVELVVYLVFAMFLVLLMHWFHNKNSLGAAGGVYNDTSTRRILVPYIQEFAENRDGLAV